MSDFLLMLKRNLLLRTSENAVNAKFAEFPPFYEVGCIVVGAWDNHTWHHGRVLGTRTHLLVTARRSWGASDSDRQSRKPRERSLRYARAEHP